MNRPQQTNTVKQKANKLFGLDPKILVITNNYSMPGPASTVEEHSLRNF